MPCISLLLPGRLCGMWRGNYDARPASLRQTAPDKIHNPDPAVKRRGGQRRSWLYISRCEACAGCPLQRQRVKCQRRPEWAEQGSTVAGKLAEVIEVRASGSTKSCTATAEALLQYMSSDVKLHSPSLVMPHVHQCCYAVPVCTAKKPHANIPRSNDHPHLCEESMLEDPCLHTLDHLPPCVRLSLHIC